MKHFLVILNFFVLIFAKDIEFYNQWVSILHLYNKNLGNYNKVFYLSYPVVSAENELTYDLKEIRNKNKKFICNFPYRYLFLKKYFNLPDFNLKKCYNLQNFLQNFNYEKLGLVFSAEYSSSPQSSFGHIMLILKNKKSLINSDVIHFAAKTKKDSFFTYSYKGLTGKYNAFYIREKFYNKINLYNFYQQRIMYVYWLDFSKKDIKKLIYHLYELRKFKGKYYFLDYNCASATLDLLKIIDPKILYNKIIILPIDVVFKLQQHITNYQILEPLEIKIVLLTELLSKKEKKIFYNIITFKKNSFEFDNFSNTLKELLVLYYEYRFKKYHIIYPNYNKVVSINYKHSKVNIKNYVKNPLNLAYPSEINIHYSKNLTYIKFRPFLINRNDEQNDILSKKTYEIFTFETKISNSKINLNSFNLFNTENLSNIYIPYLKPFSWGLYIGFNRENIDNKLLFENEVKYGLFENTILGNFGLIGAVGIDYNLNKNIYFKPYIIYSKKINNVEIISQYYDKFLQKNFYSGNIALNYHYNNRFFIGIEYFKNKNLEKIFTNINYNF